MNNLSSDTKSPRCIGLRAKVLDDVLRCHDSVVSTTMDGMSTIGDEKIPTIWFMKKTGIDLDALAQTPTVLFSKRIRTACNTAGIAAEPSPMADRVNMNRQTCHKYLNAGTSIEKIPAAALFQIADALKCSARWLYTGEGAPWNSIARTNEENEVIKIMREVSPGAIEHVVESARGQLAKEKSAPDTGRFSPAAPSKQSAPPPKRQPQQKR